MTRLGRLFAAVAATAVLLPLACVEAPAPTSPTGAPPARLLPPRALPSLQIAEARSVAPVSPGFLRCDGVSARSGDTLFCYDEQPRNFQEAEDHCKQMGGHLADIRTAGEAAAVRAAFGAPLDLPNTLWIGLVEPFREGDWGWMSGKRATYQSWNAGEPNDAGGEDCAERISSSGKWNDIDCAAQRGFLCEGPKIPTGGKAVASKSPAFKCSGVAVQAGDTPICVYTDRQLDAAHAEEFCKASGGHLAEPLNAEKDQALFAALGPRVGTGDAVWIGLSDAAHEGDWRTVSGEVPSFTAWRGGEPNNVGPAGENCANWGPGDGRWNDVPCDVRGPSLCRGAAEPAVVACDGPLPFSVAGCANIAAAGATASASASASGDRSGPEKAMDGDCATSWNAGGGASQYWQVDLGAIQELRGVTLAPEMTPGEGKVAHDVSVSNDGTVFRAVLHYDGIMVSKQVYPLDFGAPVKARYVRVTTSESPSWVAWREVGVFRCP